MYTEKNLKNHEAQNEEESLKETTQPCGERGAEKREYDTFWCSHRSDHCHNLSNKNLNRKNQMKKCYATNEYGNLSNDEKPSLPSTQLIVGTHGSSTSSLVSTSTTTTFLSKDDRLQHLLCHLDQKEAKRRSVVWELLTSEIVYLLEHLMTLKYVSGISLLRFGEC